MIAGKGWSLRVQEPSMLWILGGDGEQGFAALNMVNDHFSAEELESHRMSILEYGREFGMLYPKAAEFLNEWGIKCEVVGLKPVQFEAPPPAD